MKLKKMKISTENKGLSVFPNYLYGIILTSRIKESIGFNYPPMFCEYYDGSNRWANDMDAANKIARSILKRIIKDETFAKTVLKGFYKSESEMKEFCRWAENTNLKKLDRNELSSKLKQFTELYTNLIINGWLPLASEGFNGSFTELLKRHIRDKTGDAEKANRYFVIMTTPDKKSKRQEAEEELVRLANSRKKSGNNDTGMKDFIEKFLQRFRWITFDYEGPAMGYVDVIKRINELSNLRPEKKAMADRKRIEAEIDLPGDMLYNRLFLTIREFMYIKNLSQEIQFHAHYCLEKILLEISSRTGIGLELVRSIALEEIIDALEGNTVDRRTLINRRRHCVFVFRRGIYEIITGEKNIRKFLNESLEKEIIEPRVKITGQTACSGYAIGKVRIIQTVDDMANMLKGDILVSSKTSPNLLPAIRKAAAIVTDYGGITCHAAIISREYSIPCVIGTVKATKILRNSDVVSVDADKGVVDIIKRQK
jgi:phosphohistidine swiveling domain-containing protein